MTSPDLYQSFARYNLKMNEKTYAVVKTISDDERKRDRGAFFGSIHSTLNHILFGDCAWMNRIAERDYPLKPIGEDLYDDFSALQEARNQADADILRWTEQLTLDRLSQSLTWTSGVDGLTRTKSVWLLTSHMFNHQTHHRGQITTLLSQMGLDIGTTDLPWICNEG